MLSWAILKNFALHSERQAVHLYEKFLATDKQTSVNVPSLIFSEKRFFFMALGKKELTAAVVIGIAAVAAAVHFLIFQQKAQTYAQTSQEYQAAVEQLANAEFIRDQQAFTEYKQRTTQYESLATSVVAQLNLQKLDIPTSPPVGAIDQWASQTIVLLSQLNQRRQGGVRLTFLEQNGWNLPAQLPNYGGAGALEDRINRLIQAYRVVQASRQVQAAYNARIAYNTALEQLGISAREVSNFAYPSYMQPQLFFNSEQWIIDALKANPQAGGSQLPGGGYDLRNYYNVYGLHRFGQAVPALKKIWMYALISQAMGQNANPDMMHLFGEALEVGIPLDGDEPLNSINKQLQALVDLIDTAGRNQVQEIQYATLMRPINIAKAQIRTPGATPPPAATPTPTPAGGMGMGMGMDMGMYGMGMGMATPVAATPVPDAEKVGTGAGIELWMIASNSSLVRFYYDVTHKTATYGVDDVYVRRQQNGLMTTATIEIITDVNLQGAAATPAEGVTQ
jgi:hypothetical protein